MNAAGIMLAGSSRPLPGGVAMCANAARWPRWKLFASSAGLLALIVLLAPVLPRPPSTAARAGFAQIHPGMTEQQVENLLGGPRGVYGLFSPHPIQTAAGTDSGHLSWWYFPDCTIELDFDKDHRVNEKRIELLPRESLIDRGLQWWRG
jgi:hypothetical protein